MVIKDIRLKLSVRHFLKKFGVASIVLFAFLLIGLPAAATHLRAGNITVRRVSCTSNDFEITITAYTRWIGPSSVLFSENGAGTLDFGDGKQHHPVLQPPQYDPTGMPVPGFTDEFRYVVYRVTHTYNSGTYTISYTENNRNENILNISNSVSTAFSIKTLITIDALGNCDNSPTLLVPPIDKACRGVRWQHNPGAVDVDNDSLSYAFVVPNQTATLVVNGYVNPADQVFYGNTYPIANQDKNGPPSLTIDKDGTITWDAPGAVGEYNIAFHVIEWRRQADGQYVQIGYVRRDMQIIVEDCDNNLPPNLTISVPNVCVEAGQVVDEDITALDPESNPVRIEAYSNLFSLAGNPATKVPNGLVFQPTSPGSPALMHFHWEPLCKDVAEQPYQVVFKATDQPHPPPNTNDVLIQFKVMKIKVVSPAPKWTSVTAAPGNAARLIWQSYYCNTAADKMQIWRRVDSSPYTPTNCVTGMPDNLGYVKIAEVPINTLQYLDQNNGAGLAPGAQYCYRLVAAFPLPAGGFSYVSQELCFTTKMDAPVITNVSIDFTDQTNGSDTIKWIPPKTSDIDVIAYPPPYTYKVLRAEGFTGGNLQPVAPGTIDTTFFIDKGLNTKDQPYNYRVIAFSGSNAIDTSARASSVRLELHPGVTSIELNWAANVPWGLLTSSKHTIYRGPEGSTRISDLVPIDSVDVLAERLHYIDSGKYNNQPLENSKFYCYAVKTIGSYGNANIPNKLINFSQIQCAQPNDTVPPCKVIVNAKGTNCSDIYAAQCALNSYSNTVTWAKPTTDCSRNSYRYNVYIASESGGEYKLTATVADTFYIDSNLASFARCYRISAVSRSEVEGPLSDPFCFDNCPNFELPNVFTPNAKDGCNDLFSAYSDRFDDEQGTCVPLTTDFIRAHCARFVNSVNFTVYNRWGKEVYNYESGGENTIYIDWDGRDDQNKEVSAGIYYYVAIVNFNVVDPKSRNKTIKGWVHVIR